MVKTANPAKGVWQGVDAADSTSGTARRDNAVRQPLLKLHYYFDPLCGWCYAAAPLIHAAAECNELAIQLHAGGMMSGDNRQTVTPALRNYVMPHDKKIAALTGQEFGDAYFNGLLRDENAVFDSTPPTLAILAAADMDWNVGGDEGIGPRGLAMLARIQQAHYAQGQRIADGTVLLSLATELGFESAAFAQAMTEQAAKVDAHFTATRAAMSRQHLRGFPSLVLDNQGVPQVIDILTYLGKPTEFVQFIRSQLTQVSESIASEGVAFCTPEACTV